MALAGQMKSLYPSSLSKSQTNTQRRVGTVDWFPGTHPPCDGRGKGMSWKTPKVAAVAELPPSH